MDYSRELVESSNFGMRGKFDGSKQEQWIGLIGENTIKSVLGFPLTESDGFDGGYDFIINQKKVDVKTMSRTVHPKPHYYNNFVEQQIYYDCDIYLFCSLNINGFVLSVCGWIEKDDFIKKSSFVEEGTELFRDDGTSFIAECGMYMILNRKLNDLKSINQLRKIGRPSQCDLQLGLFQ